MFSRYRLKSSLGYILLVLGILGYVLSYFINETSCWYRITIKIGDICITGVVLGYLTQTARYLGVFRKELQEIVLGEKFLGKQKDLYDMWQNLSKQLIEKTYPQISSSLIQILQNYLPKDATISHLENYKKYLKIEWLEPVTGKIKLTETVSYTLLSHNKDKVSYEFLAQNPVESKDKIVSFKIDKKDVPCREDQSRDGTDYIYKRTYTTEGKNKYFVEFVREQEYNIFDDPYIGFHAQHITNGLTVTLEHPSDIKSLFIARGVPNKFDQLADSSTTKVEEYKDILLPEQGYIFILNKSKM